MVECSPNELNCPPDKEPNCTTTLFYSSKFCMSGLSNKVCENCSTGSGSCIVGEALAITCEPGTVCQEGFDIAFACTQCLPDLIFEAGKCVVERGFGGFNMLKNWWWLLWLLLILVLILFMIPFCIKKKEKMSADLGAAMLQQIAESKSDGLALPDL